MRKFSRLCSGMLLLASAAACAQPVIRATNGVLNASSYTPGIARGSWFVIFGTGLGPTAIAVYPGGPPYPLSWSGTSVTFNALNGGPATNCYIWYTSDGQVAALLPSTTSAGDYNVVVSYNGVLSAPYRATVVERNFGFATQTENGAGPAQATYGGYNLNRFTTGVGGDWTRRPASLGETVILWGTGLGADPKSDADGGTSGDMTASAQVKVVLGGVEVTPTYAGRSPGNPGLDQINFIVPPTAAPTCFAGLQVRTGSKISNISSLAIRAGSDLACTNPYLTQSQLRILDNGYGGRLLLGNLNISKFAGPSSNTETTGGSFSGYRIDQIAATNLALLQTNSCSLFHRTGTQAEIVAGVPPPPTQDAGAQLKLSTAGGLVANVLRQPDGAYFATLYNSDGGPGSPTLVPGAYTMAGVRGADISDFTATVSFPAGITSNLSGIASPISRSQNLTVTWPGGGSGQVVMTGISATSQNQLYDAIGITCTAPAAAGSFTIPASVLGQLPRVPGDGTGGTLGLFSVYALNSSTFTAPLTGTEPANIDQGLFTAANGSSKFVGWN
jgi:uncharacterized protein (TIGR03437 family)